MKGTRPMPIRLRYSPEYRRVPSLLDPLAMRALEQVEDDIAFDPSIGPYRQADQRRRDL